jgi:hypothetical protein
MQVAAWDVSDARAQRGSALPLFLAILFLLAGLLLYVTSTIPAQREHTLLRDKQAELTALKDRLETLLGSWRGREHAMAEDIETLLVEIDSLNLVPEDLLPDVHVRMRAPVPQAKEIPPAQKPPRKAAPAPETRPQAPGRPRSFSANEPSKRP